MNEMEIVVPGESAKTTVEKLKEHGYRAELDGEVVHVFIANDEDADELLSKFGAQQVYCSY